MIIHRDGWKYSGRVPAFFTPGCYACDCAGSVTQTYHTFYGNKVGAISLTNNDDWFGGSWTSRAAASQAQFARSGANFLDGIAYHACGYFFSGSFQHDTDKYTTSGDSWTGLTDPPSPLRQYAAGSAVSKMYVMGGEDQAGFPVALSDNDEYDTSGNSWTNKTNLPSPARRMAAAFADGTYVYLTGGADSSTTLYQDNDRYDPSGDSYTAKTDIPTPARAAHSAFVISSKGYIACGGIASKLRDMDEYSIAGDSWTNKTDSPLPARQWHGGASVDASTVGWITGGQDSSAARIKDHDEYTPDTWTNRTDLTGDARQFNNSVPC